MWRNKKLPARTAREITNLFRGAHSDLGAVRQLRVAIIEAELAAAGVRFPAPLNRSILLALALLGFGAVCKIRTEFPAQFDAGSETERLYTRLTLNVYYTDSVDYTPPSIWSVTSESWQGMATFSVEASDDASGIASVRVTYEYATGQWRDVQLVCNSNTGVWEGTVSSLLSEFSYLVQVVDGAGNVSTSSNKGRYFAAAPRRTYLPLLFRSP